MVLLIYRKEGEKLTFTNKLISFSDELIKEIEVYQKEKYIKTFTAAVIELVRKGLKKEG